MSTQTISQSASGFKFAAVKDSQTQVSGPTPTIREGVTRFDQPFQLRSGRMLKNLDISWRLIGDERLPLVLVLGGISAGRQVWGKGPQGRSGWWQAQIGPGKPIDTRHFAVLAIDYVGGSGKSTGPLTARHLAGEFPAIDTLDQAAVVVRLLDALRIHHLANVIGASYGGMVALQLAAHYPGRLQRALVVCAAHQSAPLASSLRHVQRQILRFGLKHYNEREAVSIARSLAMCSYRSEREFSERFAFGTNGALAAAAYIDHCGQKFSDHFDLHAYLCLSQSIDDHQVDPSDISIPVDLLGFTSDQIVPPHQLETLRGQLSGAGLLHIFDSPYGHDAFLKETAEVGAIIRAHLQPQLTEAA